MQSQPVIEQPMDWKIDPTEELSFHETTQTSRDGLQDFSATSSVSSSDLSCFRRSESMQTDEGTVDADDVDDNIHDFHDVQNNLPNSDSEMIDR